MATAVAIDQADELVFSLWSGYNYYKPLSEGFAAHTGNFPRQRVNVKSGQKCYCVPVPEHQKKLPLPHWLYMISHPPASGSFVWPIDLVRFADESSALVFPVRADIGSDLPRADLFGRFSDFDERNMRRPAAQFGLGDGWICAFLSAFLPLCARLEAQGYALQNLSAETLFWIDGKLLLDFSCDTLIASIDPSIEVPPDCGDPNYADPFQWGKATRDVISARFSVASLLFKLLVGTLPYCGVDMRSVPNDPRIKDQHRDWLNAYYRSAVFIFDETDTSNALTTMDDDPIYTQHWNALPPDLQGMFRRVFAGGNAMRRNRRVFSYGAAEWLAAMPLAAMPKEVRG